jgi:hypothetical protein
MLAFALGCGEPSARIKDATLAQRSEPTPWSDAWILHEGERFLNDTAYRRAALEHSLLNPQNLYSRQRLASYGLGARRWDRLPAWNPRTQPVTAELAASAVGQLLLFSPPPTAP